MMTTAAYFLGWLLATLYGAGFHLWQGGSGRRLFLYLLAGWLGFALGHYIGNLVGFRVLAIGPLNVLPATLAAIMALFISKLLATHEQEVE